MHRNRHAALGLMLALATLMACSGETSEEEPTGQPSTSNGTTPSDSNTATEAQPSIEVRDFEPGPMSMRRLTRSQYISSIQAIFGQDLEVLPPTEVDIRIEGLLTIGASVASVTPAGLERYEASARQIASDALSEGRRGRILDCEPANPAAPDDACAASFIGSIAPLVLRRELRAGELDAYVTAASDATQTRGGFYQGLEAVLSALLLS
ncbi:MAG: DUF1587 domain-containing protein, partial [Myxococcota bacterium]